MAVAELVVIEICLLCVACAYLIRHYKGRLVTFDVTASVYLSWVLGFVGILLLPFDMSVALVNNTTSKSLGIIWLFIYVGTFALAWVILPIQMEYHSSGHFGFKHKLQDAFARNAYFLIAGIIAGFIFIIYMLASGAESISQVIVFMMAMGNTYGVLLITLLMGNGLITLPRRIWQMGDTEYELKRMLMEAVHVESSYQDARFALEDCEHEVECMGTVVEHCPDVNVKKFFNIIKDSVANFAFHARSTSRRHVKRRKSEEEREMDVTADVKSLVVLNAKLIRRQTRANSCERRWFIHLSEAKRLENLVKASTQEDPLIGEDDALSTNSDTPSLWGRCGASPATVEWYTKYGFRTLSVLCGIASALILWSEMMMSSDLKSPIGLMMSWHHGDTPEGNNSHILVVQTISFLALSYMSICTYWPLFRINLGWAFRLEGRQMSPTSALIFNGEYFSRLQFSLGYNFLLFLHIPRTENAAFMELMSNIEIIPVFGTSVTVYVPIIMTFVAILTFFNFYGRLLKMFGVESEDTISGGDMCCSKTHSEISLDDQEALEAGKKLVHNALRGKELARNKQEIELTKRRSMDIANHTMVNEEEQYDFNDQNMEEGSVSSSTTSKSFFNRSYGKKPYNLVTRTESPVANMSPFANPMHTSENTTPRPAPSSDFVIEESGGGGGRYG